MMVSYSITIKQFGEQGEKTGWTYIEVPADTADEINPGVKKSYRVKGSLDHFKIKGVSILPMGDGSFIIPLNAAMRKGIGKRKGATMKVKLELDKEPLLLNKDLLDCLADDPLAKKHFESLSGSHRNYFSKWIDTAKTEATKTKRIAMAVNALARKWGFPEMLRNSRKEIQ
jgi:hypothetical protein